MEAIPSCFGPRRRYKTSKLPNNFFVNEPRPSPPSPYDVPLLLRDRESQRASLVPSFLLRGGDIVAPEAYPQDEIFFRSTDGKDVKAKLYRVETNTSGMIPETWTPLDSTVIGLPETAAVLHILFQFINPGNPPDLRGLPFDSLARLTKAAEKYQVFNAMSICSERMRSLSDQYPKQILVYGLHYNYPAIVDETAPHVVTSEKLADIFPLLPLDHHSRWLGYYGLWVSALQQIVSYSFEKQTEEYPRSRECWELCWKIIVKRLSKGVRSLNDPTQTYSVPTYKRHPGCPRCRAACISWKSYAESVISQIPQYNSIISPDDVN